MDVPPNPKPKGTTPEGLAEVERALSVLQGRHPDSERMRREDEERRAKRKAEQEAIAQHEARRILLRRLAIGAAASAVAIVAITATVLIQREVARSKRMDAATEPFRAAGFELVESSNGSEPSKLDASVSAGCLIATSTLPSRMRITHAGGSVEGASPILTCLCEGGHVTVTGDGKPEERVVLLRADANVVGGSRAFAFLSFKPGTTGRTDQACAEASLDAWLDSKKWQPSADDRKGPRPSMAADASASDGWFSKDPKRAALRDVGFTVAAFVKPEAPFGVLQVPASTCVLVASEQDRLSLRLKGGTLGVGPAAGNVGWCTAEEALVVVQRESEADDKSVKNANNANNAKNDEIAVLLAPAARAGGLFGLREITDRAELPLAAATVTASDHGWDAKNLLLASAIPEGLISVANAPELGADPDARIIALSLEKPGSLVADAPPDVFSFCDPTLSNATGTICAFSGPQKWRLDGAQVVAGLARAKLPFWLFALQGVTEPAALKLETELIAMARRLRRDGFEPTTIDAVTELEKGAEVLGRANEDAMVVFGLAPISPWVFPYSDGPAWSVTGEPRVIPIKPLERITVTSASRSLPPKATRRTVVFRRQKR